MSKAVLRVFFILLLVAAWACGRGGLENLPGGDGTLPKGNPENPPETPLTPTPPVPVFGNFVLGVASSLGPSPLGPAALTSRSLNIVSNSQGISLDGIQVAEIRKIISNISFKPDQAENPPDHQGGCDRKHPNQGCKAVVSGEIQFPGNFVIELIRDGQIVDLEFPEFGSAMLPFDTYHSFEMEFKPLPLNGIPPELLEDPVVIQFLEGRSLVMTGSFPLIASKRNSFPADQEIPFLLLSNHTTSIRVSSPNAFEVVPERENFFFIAFRIGDWFNGVLPQLQDISPNDLEGGVLIISQEHQNPLVRQILSLIEGNIDLATKSAPSLDDVFQEGDVDEDSFSVPF